LRVEGSCVCMRVCVCVCVCVCVALMPHLLAGEGGGQGLSAKASIDGQQFDKQHVFRQVLRKLKP